MLAIVGNSAALSYGILHLSYGWQPEMALLLLYGLAFSVLLVVFVGIAFGTLVALVQTLTVLAAFGLSEELGGVETAPAAVVLGCGLTARLGWAVSERLANAHEALHGGTRILADRVSLSLVVLLALSLVANVPSWPQRLALGALFVLALFLDGALHDLRRWLRTRRRNGYAFISYSRSDPASRRRAEELYRGLQPDAAFLDRSTIVPGAEWSESIRAHLDRATVLLAVDAPGLAGLAASRESPSFWLQLERGYAHRLRTPIVPVPADPHAGEVSEHLQSFQAVGGDSAGVLLALERTHGVPRRTPAVETSDPDGPRSA